MYLSYIHEHSHKHAALTPLEIQEFLRPAFDLARELQLQSYAKDMSEKIPFVTVRHSIF